MASVGEQIVAAMFAALNTAPSKPCAVYRNRVDALAAAELPAMIVYAVDERPGLRGPNTMLRLRTVRLECMVEAAPPADVLVDPLYVFAIVTLQADPTLQRLTRKITETSIQWETEASYQDRTVALVDLQVDFVTQLVDPSVAVS